MTESCVIATYGSARPRLAVGTSESSRGGECERYGMIRFDSIRLSRFSFLRAVDLGGAAECHEACRENPGP